MRRLLLPLSACLLLLSPAWAQFEVMDPKDPVLPPAGGVLFAAAYAEYVWNSQSVFTRHTGETAELLLIESGVAKVAGSPPATAIQRLGGGEQGLHRLAPPLLLEGEYDTCLLADLTGDDSDEVIIRCEVTSSGDSAGPAVPYSGRKPPKGSTLRRTTVVSFEDVTNRVLMLLQQDAPAEVKELPGILPTESGNDLVIASFGGHAGGATAAPDAWLHYSFASSGEGQGLVRQSDLVMTPVPITSLRTADLTGDGARQLISLRSFPTESYKQQLWAQRLNAKGFFENAAIGRGNDMQLLPVSDHQPGIFFLWNDVKAKIPRTHLTSLKLDADGKPAQQLDLALSSVVSLKSAAWGQTRPFQATPQLGMLLRPAALEETWLGIVTFMEGTTAPSISMISHPSFTGLTSLTAFDVNGDGYDDWISVGNNGLLVYDPIRETINERAQIATAASGTDHEDQLFSLIPE